jgi:hypothetical protein
MPLDPSIHILDLAVSTVFDTDGICFAATDAGLWRTADGGTSWEPAVSELAAGGGIAATAVAVSPAFASDGVVLMSIPGGIGVSSDGGRSWRFGQLPLPAPVVSSIVFSPRFDQDAVAFLGTVQDGVFRSDDGGSTWVPWNSGLLDASVTSLAISPNFAVDQTIFAGTTTGVFRSSNGGRRWTPVDFQEDSHVPISGLGVMADGSDGLVVFAGSETGDLWSSADMGESWRGIGEYTGGTVRAITTASMESAHARVALLGDETLMHSIDGGERWTIVEDLPVISGAIVAIAATGSPDGELIAVTEAGDILRLQDH